MPTGGTCPIGQPTSISASRGSMSPAGRKFPSHSPSTTTPTTESICLSRSKLKRCGRGRTHSTAAQELDPLLTHCTTNDLAGIEPT
eukprot:CAMPEP_0117582188 /NCGR_PEP_ID=MMETSP0784-20121206/66282_1 /TAXON_ID=39447 /ORGANISM="" /LENGTH=85 /DNA_ID=CAMNT_0005382659 /DNA_START=39 /DNA_END=292 /DNA_ORIENTATION=-